jgi:hypothetical protein
MLFSARAPGRWSFICAILLAVTWFLLWRPFNFYGGAGSVGNRYFLPLYPLLWFLPVRKVRPFALAISALPAAFFVWPLLMSPNAFPVVESGISAVARYRYVGDGLRRLLPHEASQKHLRALWSEDVYHANLWIRFLDDGVRPTADTEHLEVVGGGGEILVGVERRPRAFVLEVTGGPHDLRLSHRWRRASVEEGGAELGIGRPSAYHGMWWPGGPVHLYRMRLWRNLDDDEPTALRLRALF